MGKSSEADQELGKEVLGCALDWRRGDEERNIRFKGINRRVQSPGSEDDNGQAQLPTVRE